ncbi:MAG: TlpA family protein disulfide reductase [Gammaproteobacteria bacterium]|nr:TlpA family protein disulfide reductase [Gammaproteobacteria bacterium]
MACGLLFRSGLLLLILAQPAMGGAPAPAGLTALSGRPSAPAFDLFDIEGRRHRLEAYRGRVVVVNFWAIWCPPCRAEMPSLQRAWRQLRERDIVLLAVDVGESGERVAAFAAKQALDFPLLLDERAAVFDSWRVPGLPTTFVIDRSGRLAYRASGAREWDAPEILEAILELNRQGRLP